MDLELSVEQTWAQRSVCFDYMYFNILNYIKYLHSLELESFNVKIKSKEVLKVWAGSKL